MVRGRSATVTRSPVVSAMRLKECPVPRARIRPLPATTRCSCSTLVGPCRRWALKVMLRAQLVMPVVMSVLSEGSAQPCAQELERGLVVVGATGLVAVVVPDLQLLRPGVLVVGGEDRRRRHDLVHERGA